MTKARLYWLVATGLIAAQARVAWAHGFNFNERGLAAGTFVVFSLLMLIVALPIRAWQKSLMEAVFGKQEERKAG